MLSTELERSESESLTRRCIGFRSPPRHSADGAHCWLMTVGCRRCGGAEDKILRAFGWLTKLRLACNVGLRVKLNGRVRPGRGLLARRRDQRDRSNQEKARSRKASPFVLTTSPCAMTTSSGRSLIKARILGRALA